MYQALLFSSRVLEGTWRDEDGRLTVAPPRFSDHEIVNGALDVEDAQQFVNAFQKQPDIANLQIWQPYCGLPCVCDEPWYFRLGLAQKHE